MYITTKSVNLKKLPDPEDDRRVDMFWESLSLKDRAELAVLDKKTVITKIKSKLKRRCTCHDCRFSKISYFDPQVKLIDNYIHQLEANACTCSRSRQHRDFSDDDHRNVEEWRNLIPTPVSLPASPPPSSSCSYSSSCCPEEEKEKERKEKEEDKENKEEKETKRKATCDECRSRINFEINIASVLEEKVTEAQRQKVLELQSKVICEMLLKEEKEKKTKKQKRTAGNRAHHHHCSHHPKNSSNNSNSSNSSNSSNVSNVSNSSNSSKSSKRRKAAARESEIDSEEIQMTEAPLMVVNDNQVHDNQVIIMDSSLATMDENDLIYDPEDWTIVGKTKKKNDQSTNSSLSSSSSNSVSPRSSSPPPFSTSPEATLKTNRKKPSNTKPEYVPATPQPSKVAQLQKVPEWKGWKLPPQQTTTPVIQQVPEEAIVNDQFVKREVSKVVQPPSPKAVPSVNDVKEATKILLSAIKLTSSSRALDHLDLQTSLLESLRALSLAGDSVLGSVCEEPICCEEETCGSGDVPCMESGCSCTYYTNCFSLPMIFESNIWAK